MLSTDSGMRHERLGIDEKVREVSGLWARWRVRIPAAIVTFATVTAITYLIARPWMFTGFAPHDDEGYMLTALKSFVHHGQLYDRVFTQYGPFYFEFWGGIFSIFGIAVTHDAGRTATMVAWIVSSLAFGLATMRMTASLLLGLATQILTFAALGVLANDSMHPIGIIALLLAAMVAISCLVRERVSLYPMAGLGALLAALLLVKVNVGVFACVSVALACVVSYPALAGRRLLRPAVEVAFVALPILLMFAKLDEGWARHYAIHVAIAALAVVLILRAREDGRRPGEELRWLAGGFVVIVLVACATVVAAGTSLDGLIDGVVRQPLRQTSAFVIPMQLSGRLYALDLLGLAAAGAYWYASRTRRGPAGSAWLSSVALLSIGVGIALALSVTGKVLPFDPGTLAGYQLSMLSFAWVALVALPDSGRAPAFPCLLLPLLAVLQALHGYPVAGSQTLLSAVLLIPVGAICVANGVRGLASVMVDGADRRALAGCGALAAVVLLWFVANAGLREPLRFFPTTYDSGAPLALPGSHAIHLSEEEAKVYRDVSTAIDRNCPALVMQPGMNSFYLWTEQEPPSYTATGWETLFDDSRQRRVITDTRGIAGLCLLRNRRIASLWGEAEGPLVRYLEHRFAPVANFGEYELLRRRTPVGVL
jgi:hypothetical protein